jgi:hypothetical protein
MADEFRALKKEWIDVAAASNLDLALKIAVQMAKEASDRGLKGVELLFANRPLVESLVKLGEVRHDRSALAKAERRITQVLAFSPSDAWARYHAMKVASLIQVTDQVSSPGKDGYRRSPVDSRGLQVNQPRATTQSHSAPPRTKVASGPEWPTRGEEERRAARRRQFNGIRETLVVTNEPGKSSDPFAGIRQVRKPSGAAPNSALPDGETCRHGMLELTCGYCDAGLDLPPFDSGWTSNVRGPSGTRIQDIGKNRRKRELRLTY